MISQENCGIPFVKLSETPGDGEIELKTDCDGLQSMKLETPTGIHA